MDEARLMGLVDEAVRNCGPADFGDFEWVKIRADLWSQIVIEVLPMTMSREPDGVAP